MIMPSGSIKIFQSFIILLVLVSLLGMRPFNPEVPGTTINVTTTVDDFGEPANNSTCSLREAIQAANTDLAFGGCPAGGDADTILVPAGTYILTRTTGGVSRFEDLNEYGDLDIFPELTTGSPLEVEAPAPFITYIIKISGAARDTTIIDGNGLDRVFDIHGNLLLLENLTIQNGLTPSDDPPSGFYPMEETQNGGGIYNNAKTTLVNVKVNNNACGHGSPGGHGGGIYNNGVLDITSSLITGNAAGDGGSGLVGGDGGGIYSTIISTLYITGSTITNNQAGQTPSVYEGVPGAYGGNGGGINQYGYGEIRQSTIAYNGAGNDSFPGSFSSAGNGGGIYVGYSGSQLILYSNITGNAAGSSLKSNGGDGGGIYNYGSMTLGYSTVNGNHAGDSNGNEVSDRGGNGGGIFNTGDLLVQTSTISGNAAGMGVTSHADGSGGGIFNSGSEYYPADLTLWLSTVADNNAGLDDGLATGGGLFNSPNIYSSTQLMSTILANNFLRSNPANQSDCTGTINSLGCNLIRSNSGCTITGDTTGNLTDVDPRLGPLSDNGGDTLTHFLYAASPAIDAGCSGAGETADQRGETRPQDGDNNGTDDYDIGAYEVVFGELHPGIFLPLLRK